MLKSVLVVTILVGLFGWLQFAATACDEASPGEQKLLRHVVMFGFKESSSEADVQVVVDAFRKLPEQIPEIAAFEYGTNNSPEGLNDGLTHCFFVSFKSEADRAAYLPHPAHKAFVEVLKPHLEKVVVIDYWAAQ
ncbi:MAG: Dabb family protein [Planctomycetota bacterium]